MIKFLLKLWVKIIRIFLNSLFSLRTNFLPEDIVLFKVMIEKISLFLNNKRKETMVFLGMYRKMKGKNKNLIRKRNTQ